jgi:hypothetical protein
MIGPLIIDLEALAGSLRRGSAVNVNDQSSKDRAIGLTTRYFSNVRPEIVAVVSETEAVLGHDELWQQLIRLAHGNNARKTYLKIIGLIRKQLTEFNISLVAMMPAQAAQARIAPSREELTILRTLESLVPSAAASYRQGLSDLNGDRLSYRGTASEFREALRETLDHLAADSDVESQKWYKPEEGQKKPTMKQKTRYILTSRDRGKTQRDTADKLIGLIEELSGELARAVYNRASIASHVHQNKAEVQKIKRYVDTIFFDILEVA